MYKSSERKSVEIGAISARQGGGEKGTSHGESNPITNPLDYNTDVKNTKGPRKPVPRESISSSHASLGGHSGHVSNPVPRSTRDQDNDSQLAPKEPLAVKQYEKGVKLPEHTSSPTSSPEYSTPTTGSPSPSGSPSTITLGEAGTDCPSGLERGKHGPGSTGSRWVLESEQICEGCAEAGRKWNLYKAPCDMCKLRGEITGLKEQLDLMHERHNTDSNRIAHMDDFIMRLTSDLNFQRSNNHHLFEEKIQQEKRFRSEIADWKNKYKNLESEIGKLQRTELGRLHKRNVLMDDTARYDIETTLETKTRLISRLFFRRVSWKDIEAKNQSINNEFPPFLAKFSNWPITLWPVIRRNPAFSVPVLVDATLYSIIINGFFKSPFFRAGDGQEALDRIHLRGMAVNPSTTQAWRAKTAGLLKEFAHAEADKPEDSGSTAPSDGTITIEIITNQVAEFLRGILELHGKGSPDIDIATLDTKVRDLVLDCAKLAEDWHSHEFRFSVINEDWLSSHGVDWNTETAGKYIQPLGNKVPGKNMEYRVIAVAVPGFIRYERGDNEGPEKEIVWQKASVLLERREIFQDPLFCTGEASALDSDQWMGGMT
ncbi:hypothetical protein TWF718_005733 [Orbilia javanica]|uniref:Uncharacterized protein n=1 Tax=Orbilia javanica TaxID=47235 RepID=A0AAN8MQC7_9PEZI